MSNLNSLTNQLAWCRQTETYLRNELEYALRRSVDSVATTMEVLEKALMSEQMDKIRPFTEPFNSEAVKLYRLIHDKDLPYIQTQIDYLNIQIENINNGTNWITQDSD